MLWQKESNRKNAFYTDLTKQMGIEGKLNMRKFLELRAQNNPQALAKNDQIALQKREKGNQHFRQGEFLYALESYNESICFAESKSKNLSLGYANRAATFLKMKQYNECLVDIALAKNSGYPKDLMPKLNQRYDDCLKGISEGTQYERHHAQLDFEPDEKFPCMANVLKIERNDDGEYVMVAKEDIDIGKTIVLEKIFLKYLSAERAQKCNICLKSYTNLFPCDKCSAAMFCSDECFAHFLHEYECGAVAYTENSALNGSVMNDVRSILLAINMFATIDDLIAFVEETINRDPNELPDSLLDAKSQYRAFLKLTINDYMLSKDQVICIMSDVYMQLMKMPKIEGMFKSKKHRQFLMHLIGHHIKIIEYNSVQGFIEKSEGKIECYNHTVLIEKYVKHSCAPNVVTCEGHGNHVFVTIRPVKKGDHINFSFFNFLLYPNVERQLKLWERKRITCQCIRCEGISPSVQQRRRMAVDPDYIGITTHFPDTYSELLQIFFDKENEPFSNVVLAEKCISFLRKYKEVPWCREIGQVVEIYIWLYLNGKSLTRPTNW